MVSKRERNRLAAQAWAAQAEAEWRWRQRQEEEALQYKDPEKQDQRAAYTETEMYERWLAQTKKLYDQINQLFQMLGMMAVLCVLQFRVIIFLAYMAVRS